MKVFIEKTPGICGGRARLTGTRIAVWVIVERINMGQSDIRIAQSIHGLDLDGVHAAMEYYKNNKMEIDHDLWENNEGLDADE